MKIKIIKNYIYNLSYQLLSMIIPVLMVPFILSKLTKEQIGVNSYVCTNATYFSIIGMLGMKTYGIREIAKEKHNPIKISSVFWHCYTLQLLFHILAITSYLFLFTVVFTEYKDIYYLYLLLLLASMIDISWLYQGLEDFKGLAGRSIAIKSLSVILMFLLIKGPEDFYTYIISIYIPEIIVNLSMWFHSWKRIGGEKQKFDISTSYLKGTFIIFSTQFLSSIYSILDKSMVGSFCTMESLALYDNAQKLIRMIIAIIASMSAVMLPRNSMLISENRAEEMRENMKQSSYVMWAISIGMVFGIFGTMYNFVPWFYGKEYYGIIDVLSVLAFMIVPVTGAHLVAIQYLIPSGNEKPYTISLIVAAVLDIVLNLILIPLFAAIGAAISLVTAESVSFFIQLIHFRKEMSLKIIFEGIYKPLIAGLCMFAVLFPVGRMLPTTVLYTLLLIIIGILIYILIIMVLNYGNFRRLLKKNGDEK